MNHDPETIVGSAELLPGIDPEAVRAQKQRLLTDPLFSSSRRFCNLLDYLVESSLNLQGDNHKERTIGIRVFGRSSSYDTSADPTVRVAASSIRKRLAKYYAQPEHSHELRIEIPLRSYTAVFSLPESEDLPPAQKPESSEAPLPKTRRRPAFQLTFSRRIALAALISVLLLATCFFSYRLIQSTSLINQFWAPVLAGNDAIDILIGSPLDSTWPLPANASSSAASQNPLASDEIVKVGEVDTNAAVDLANFLRAKGKAVNILPAPITRIENSSPRSFILYGRFQQEWIAQLGTDLRLRFRKDPGQALRWIEDVQDPGNRSWAIHLSTPDDQLPYDYAVISRIHDTTTNRWWVGIAGLTGIGTKVANRIVIDPKAMATIGTHLPGDWKQKNIQVLFAIKLANGTAGEIHVVTVKCW